LTNHDNQDLLRISLNLVNKSTYEPKKALFLLSPRTCHYYIYLWGDVAKPMFTFGLSFSRSEQLTEDAWTRRWESFISEYNPGTQFDFSVEDAREFSRFIQLGAREGLDCATVANECHSLVDIIFPTDPILQALMSPSAYKGMTIPMIIASTIAAYPTFGWMNLFSSNPTLRSEVILLMKYLKLMEGDIYAGF
jgi:hypothetical protein